MRLKPNAFVFTEHCNTQHESNLTTRKFLEIFAASWCQRIHPFKAHYFVI